MGEKIVMHKKILQLTTIYDNHHIDGWYPATDRTYPISNIHNQNLTWLECKPLYSQSHCQCHLLLSVHEDASRYPCSCSKKRESNTFMFQDQ